jgi:hypothetical protein
VYVARRRRRALIAAAVGTRRAFGTGMNKLTRGTAFDGLRASPFGEWTYA